MDAAAARRRLPGVAIAVLVALAGFGLAGCETNTSLFGNNSLATPEPVKPAAAQAPLAKVAVAPIIGAPDGIAKQIHQDFTSAVEKQRVVVASKDERADYTLRGYIVAAKDKSGTKVSYIWDVTDPSGKRVNRITGEEVIAGPVSKDPWAALTPQVAHNMAEKAASSLATWLASQASQPVASNTAAPVGVGAQPQPGPEPVAAAPVEPPAAKTRTAAKPSAAAAVAAAPAQPGPTTGSIGREGAVVAVVPSVTGAPGDGTTTLTAAIQQELSSKGVTLSEKSAAGYRVEGKVTMGEAREGKQSIQIEWVVKDPAGKKLGTVSQKNEIPEGSLDGQWGKTAEQAAGAAAQGILKLLPQAKAVN
jgi:hypothetical protein